MSVFAFGVAVSIRVTLLIIVVAAVAGLLRRRSAAFQHALWASAIIASLCVPIVTIAALKSDAPTIALRDVDAAWTWIARSVGQRQPPVRSLRTAVAPGGLDSRMSIAIAEILNGTNSGVVRGPQIGTATIAVWALGVVVFLTRLLAAMLALGRMKGRARTVADERVLSMFAVINRTDRADVTLIESDEINAPATGGILRPSIFLPPSHRDWTGTHLRATLAHELAHVERRDCLTQLLADVARAIYWFNPLTWYARRRTIIERERACDDLVIGKGIRPTHYASVLVDTVRGSLSQPGTIALTALSMARPSELETRLVSILDPARRRNRLSRRATNAIAAAVGFSTILVAAARVEAAPALQFLEPDLRGDSIASPLSEKLRLGPDVFRAARSSPALTGPDSILAHALYMQLDRVPTWEGDLVRDRSAWALSIARNGELIAPLLAALTDRDWRVRAYAAWTLGEAREPRALPRLLPLLDSPNWRMRAMAAYAIESIASPSSVERMSGLLHDEAWQVRLAAIGYLAALDDTRYKPAIEAAVSDRHIAVRSAAAEALRKIMD